MKTYIGLRDPDGTARIMVETEDGYRRPLRHVVYHSPTGLEWGYGGSGPADAALSILADYFMERTRKPDEIGATRAWRLHQPFKWAVVALLSRDVPAHRPYAEAPVAEVLPAVESWRLTELEIAHAVQAIEGKWTPPPGESHI